MKSVVLILTMLTSFAYAGSSNSAISSKETSVSSSSVLSVKPTTRRLYFSTNFVDLTKGGGNIGLDFFVNNKFAFAFRGATSSQKEEVTKNGEKAKLTVDRTVYSLGTTVFFSGIESARTIVFSPGLAFGQKRDALDVESQNGLSAKLTGLFRMNGDLTLEGGIRGDTLEGSKGDIYGGFGYVF